MDWSRAIDSYCERTGPGYWAEPLNLVSNLAFLVAAAVAWRLSAGDRAGRILAGLIAAIGVGSWLFHGHAQMWALLADVVPIQIFVLACIAVATARFFAVPAWAGVAVALAFLPAAALTARLIAAVAGPLNGSVSYLPMALLLAGYAVALRRRAPATARGLVGVAIVFCLSLGFRSIDLAVCPVLPRGTHALWHVLNAVVLAGLVRILVRHGPAPRRKKPRRPQVAGA